MTDAEKREAAHQFINRWMGRGNEDEDGRSYWLEFLSNVMGMENPTERVNFEKKVIVNGNTKRIDVYIPETHRRYIPMGYESPETIITDSVQCIPNADLYTFGIITSNVHMAWTRVVCGRLKSDYRYSAKIVYNNFPWPEPTEQQKQKIEETAHGILDARALFPDSSLADLYDPLTMPVELRKAHIANDKAVMAAYGFGIKMTEEECVAELMKLYQKMQG